MQDHAVDNALVDPKVYADETRLHALLARLRREDPVHWTEPDRHRPFWTVTRHADVREIELAADRFLNAPRPVLVTVGEEERRRVSGNPNVMRTLIHMDAPDHRVFRGLTQAWFLPARLKAMEAGIAELAREFVDRMAARGGACDFVRDIAVWYPLRVIMMLLGVPPEDERLMLQLTQDLFGAQDRELKRQTDGSIAAQVFREFSAYFRDLTADRCKHPKDDLATVIAEARIDGQPIGDMEAMSYYVIVATAGHDTTSSTAAGGLLALLQHPAELAKLRADPALLPAAIDEMLRWVTPVRHFMRTATSDYVLNGRDIKAGDALLMSYPSANRDEAAFDAPFAFRADRSPNRHIAFGYGPHLCLGQHLAKMEVRAFFAELLPRLAEIELGGEPAWVESTFVGGLKRLPVRYRMAAGNRSAA
jgi:cytochrome P450